MITLVLRSIIVYLIVLFSVRLMGKRQIGDMQPFELVVTLIIADLACIPMSDTSIPIVFGLIPLFTLVILHYVFTFLNRKSIFFRRLLNGKPVIVITPKGIDYVALKKLNMTLNDLTEGLRACQCFNISDVSYAIVETNGNISVLLKSSVLPVNNELMQKQVKPSSLDVIIINDGKLMQENLNYLNLNNKYLENLLKKEKIKSFKDILILSANNNGDIYIQEKNKECKIIKNNLEKNAQ